MMDGPILRSEMKRTRRVYLDVCCLNRPFDDQDQERVRLEAEAVKSVLFRIGTGRWVGIGSDAIDFEVDRMSDPDRRLEITSILSKFAEYVQVGETERKRGVDLEVLGFGPTDALHVACAEKARADVLLSTDDVLLRKAGRHAGLLGVRAANPLAWMAEVMKA